MVYMTKGMTRVDLHLCLCNQMINIVYAKFNNNLLFLFTVYRKQVILINSQPKLALTQYLFSLLAFSLYQLSKQIKRNNDK